VAVSNPGYVGFSKQTTALPLVFYHNGRFFLNGVNVGYEPFNGQHYSFSILARPRINRLSASDSSQLTGIHSRKWSIDGGVRLSLFGNWGLLSASVFHDLLHRYNGTEFDLGYSYIIYLPGVMLQPGIGLKWENSQLTDYYYGVSPSETAPGRPAYTPARAINPYLRLSVGVPIGKRWRILAGGIYTHFANTIQHSPIVDQTYKFTAFVGVVYQF
jgi:outer membrane protein